MNQQVQAPPQQHGNGRSSVVLYMQGDGGAGPTWEFRDGPEGSANQILYVKDMPVFRSGTFKDSRGEQLTYDPLHIDEMAQYFNHLRALHVLTDVPVRIGHGSFFGDPITGLAGHHDDLRTRDMQGQDGQTYRYLLADFHLTEADTQQKFIKGLYRNRSSEVGYFESNEGALYYPVYQGFAFVDIPAVQYLNNFSNPNGTLTILLEKESQMSEVQGGTEGANSGGATSAVTQPPAVAPVVAPPASVPAPAVTEHGRSDAAPFAFACGGNATTDYARVQAYIVDLEAANVSLTSANASLNEFYTAQQKANRENFVKGLASGQSPVILASEIPSLTEYALSLDAAGFANWAKLYENKPAVPLLQSHSQGQAVSTPDGQNVDPVVKEFETMCERVKWNISGGMLPDTVRETPSYKRMTELATTLGKAPVRV